LLFDKEAPALADGFWCYLSVALLKTTFTDWIPVFETLTHLREFITIVLYRDFGRRSA